jgi:TetR/AcrR family transcriptional regulator, ethionamide resistance regulator
MRVMAVGRDRARYVARPSRGDQRRTKLLGALEELLAVRSLADIGIADITRAAGVTRSAFYFYFPTKAAAVAALLADFRDQMRQAGTAWYEGDTASPLERVRAAVDASIRLWRDHASLIVAMLDGIGADPEVRDIWESWTQDFVEQITARIVQDRDAGLARPTSDPHALATLLMGATLYAMERDVRAITAGHASSDAIADALVELWHRTLY